MNAPVNTVATLADLGSVPSNGTALDGRAQVTERLIGQLIAEQHELTAVESFSLWHDSAGAHGALYEGLLPTTLPAAGQQYAFEVNLDTCSGCKACVVACHTLNGLGETETWRKVGTLTSKAARLPVLQHVTTACHHCVDPGCLKGCPVLAYEKDPTTGIVRHLDDQCFGCKYCTMMCPYEVPQYSQSLGIVRKCDMCSQRLEQGEAPACVQACPNQAIKITLVDRADYRRSATSPDACVVPTAPSSRQTLPTTRFISRALGQRSASEHLVSRESDEDSVQHGHWPLVGMLVLTQASVGTWWVLTALAMSGTVPARAMVTALWVATAVGLVGVQLALLHLGRPWLAFRSFLGWRTSWLSREAIAFGVYLPCALFGLFACSYAPQYFASASVAVSLIGAVAVVCSAMIYVATGRQLWSLGRTLTEFGATAIGLGLALSSLAVDPAKRPQLLIAACFVCGVAYMPKWLDWRRSENASSSGGSWSVRSGRLLHEPLAYPWRVACCSLAIGLSIALWMALSGRQAGGMADSQLAAWSLSWSSGTRNSDVLGWGACLSLLLVSQSQLRWLGFASVVFPRMPGAGS